MNPNQKFLVRRASLSGARDGVALIIVLAFVVLLSILLVSFVSFTKLNRVSTASYSKSIQAQEIAQGGLQDIMGDLHQEILAGSTNVNGGVSSYATNYVPLTNWTAAPARLGYNLSYFSTNISSVNLPTTLLRVSRAAQDGIPTHFYPPLNTAWYTSTLTSPLPLNYASPANSATNSVNGRNVSATRWNKICMLSTNSTIPPPFATNTPDWVYLSRAGRVSTGTVSPVPSSLLPQISAVSMTPVVGRYAYAVYDEAALLDINAAGHMSLNSNYSPANQLILGTKNSVAFAELTSLPGLSGTQTSVIDPLIRWRNASVSGLATTAVPSAAQQTAFLVNVAGNYASKGFLNFSFASGTGTDSPLLGRQDLINYFAKIDSSFNTATPTYSAALPYLGTFSRAVTIPSWTPTANASLWTGGVNGTYSTYAYRDNAEAATITDVTGTVTPNANRDLQGVRYAHGGSIVHYADDGTTGTYTVKAGDLVVQHRFSLAKLAWIGHNGPNGVSAQAIYDCFGLTWNATKLCWDYDHTHSNPLSRLPNNILTLSEIASGVASVDGSTISPREPDLFECVKAGILQGSLGDQPGAVGSDSSGTTPNGPAGTQFPYYSGEKDRQTRQIGADMIDQADSDNWPTAIYQNLDILSVPPYSPSETALFNTVFGKENLPSLLKAWLMAYKTDWPNTTAGPQDYWICSELWNPNVSATAVIGTYPNTPTHLRILALGGLGITLHETTHTFPSLPAKDTPGTGTPLVTEFGTDADIQTPATFAVYLKNPQPGSTTPPDFFDTPHPLHGFNSGTTDNYQDVPFVTVAGENKNFLWYSQPAKQGTGSNASLGIWTGSLTRNSANYDIHAVLADPIASAEKQFTLALQYYDGSKWRTYDAMSRIAAFNGVSFTESWIPGVYIFGGPWENFAFGRPDPRTDRFSGSKGYQNNNSNNCNYPWYPNTTILPCNQDFAFQTSGAQRGSLAGLMPNPTAGFTYFQRPVGGGEPNGYTVDDWMRNITGASLNSYKDTDGITRPGDGWNADLQLKTAAGTFTYGGDGAMTYEYAANTGFPQKYGRNRAVILNRPFQSVGELGYVFRDQPFKTLDFWSPYSADSALLDLFSASDEFSLPIIAGQISPNAPAPVMAAIINGTMKQHYTWGSSVTGAVLPASASPAVASANEGALIASGTGVGANTGICGEALSNGPLINRADIVKRFGIPAFNSYTYTSGGSSTVLNAQCNKSYGEAYVRALAPVTNTRTWNLLIDVIAQSGHLSPNAKTLYDFVVEGEKRYWLHIAIDRYTGKIVDQQLEPVYE